VGAAAHGHAAPVGGQSQGQQDGLQDQADGPGAAAFAGQRDIEDVVTGRDGGGWDEVQLLGSKRIADGTRAAQGSRRAYRSQMLRRQAGVSPICPDPRDAEGAARDGGKAQRGTQNLAAALA
jgi:hypothetical protein